MSSNGIKCSKCKSTEHMTLRCRAEAWPETKDQICDRCFGNHLNSECKINPPDMRCSFCGHENSHYKQGCPIKEDTPGNRKQYTRERLDALEKQDANKPMNKASRDQKSNTGRKSTQSAQNHGGRKGGPSNVATLAIRKGTAPKVPERVFRSDFTPLNQLVEKLKNNDYAIKTASLPAVDQTEAEKIKAEWAKANLEVCNTTISSNHDIFLKDVVEANFFKVSFIGKNEKKGLAKGATDIRRYRIELGSLAPPARNLNDSNQRQTAGRGNVEDPNVAETERKPLKRETTRALVEGLFSQRPPSAAIWVTDWVSQVVSVGPLYRDFLDQEGIAYLVPHFRPGRGGEDGKDKVVDTVIVDERRFRENDLFQYVASDPNRDPNYLPDEDLKILNLISWTNINARGWSGTVLGTKFYPQEKDPRFTTEVTENFNKKLKHHDDVCLYKIRTGFFTSMRPGDGSLLCNVNPTTSAFYSSIKLDKWIKGMNNLLQSSSFPVLRGLRVTFEGDPGSVRDKKKRVIYEVLESTSISQQTFNRNHDSASYEVSVYDHMTEAYPQLNFDRDAICVNLRAGGMDMYYPADQLTIVDWQVVRGALPDECQKALLDTAKRDPKQNKDLLRNHALEHLGAGRRLNNKFWSNFGLKFDANFVQPKPKGIGLPKLVFGNEKEGGKAQRDGCLASWNLKDVGMEGRRGGGFLVPGLNDPIGMIVVVFKSSKATSPEIPETSCKFSRQLHGALKNYGIDLENQLNVVLAVVENTRTSIKDSMDKAHKTLNFPTIVVIQLPDKSPALYADIKWWGGCSSGVRTVCVSRETVFKAHKGLDKTLLGNLAMKINVKSEGINHKLRTLSLKPNTMVVGADVTHPGKDKADKEFAPCPSMAGVVATCEEHCAFYLPSARLQESRTENISDLKSMLVERLEAFKKWHHTKTYPEHILFYRDGVSESQFGMVRLAELPQIREAIESVKRSNPEWTRLCSITLVVVGKRHHARFYPKMPTNKSGNLEPGTIVDTVIVAPSQFSFYLQSHDSPLGTARSAHYVVLENESGYTGHDLQRVTNELCFLGSRAMHGLSVCTPARYADILCDRLRCYMRQALSKEGARKRAESDLSVFENDHLLWGTDGGRKNPWHPAVNDCMFYL